MIVEKALPLPEIDDTELPDSAPPAYDESVATPLPSRTQQWNSSEKAGSSSNEASTSSNVSPLPHPASASKKPAPAGWFASTFFSPSRAATLEVKATVSGLIKEIVRQPESTAPVVILDSCAEACRAHMLSLSSLLQEQYIENHSPIYWAIIKRPREPARPGEQDMVTALLARAAPLKDATISEIRLACLQNSDHVLFQRLRQMPVFAPLSGAEEMLMGAAEHRDEVDVEEVAGDEGAFVARFRIPMFQKRMRISNEVSLEFIARGRLWCLKFFEVSMHDRRLDRHGKCPPVGSWALSLSLLSNSPPTHLDSRLVIEETRPPADGSGQDGRTKPKPTICLRLKSGSQQLVARQKGSFNDVISLSLEESLMANSLQYAGSSYIRADESLRARLEARLAKPEAECIIC